MRLMLLSVLVLLQAACGGGQPDGQAGLPSSLLLTPAHGGNGAAWGLEDCSACHKLDVIHQSAAAIREIVLLRGYATCTGCHGDNGSKAARRCRVCHNDRDLPAHPTQAGRFRHDFGKGSPSGMADDDCLVCHQAANMNGRFELAQDLTRLPDARQLTTPYASLSEFCLRCHNRDHQQPGFALEERFENDPRVAIEAAYEHIDKHGETDGLGNRVYTGLRPNYRYASRVDCTDCHSMHGTDNLKLIIDDSTTGASRLDESLRQEQRRVEIRDGDYSQLCVLCHQMRTIQEQGDVDTGNGLSGVHATATDCTVCHRHGEAVQAGL